MKFSVARFVGSILPALLAALVIGAVVLTVSKSSKKEQVLSQMRELRHAVQAYYDRQAQAGAAEADRYPPSLKALLSADFPEARFRNVLSHVQYADVCEPDVARPGSEFIEVNGRGFVAEITVDLRLTVTFSSWAGQDRHTE